MRGPVDAIAGIYSYFDLPFSERARSAMEAHLAGHPQGSEGAHRYTAAQFGMDPAVLRANVIAQVTSPVRFVDCVNTAVGLGVKTTLETAPGRVLSGLIRRIAPDMDLVGAADAEQVSELVGGPTS